MSRYIDADALRDKLYEADAVTMRGVAIINNMPTVDAVPVDFINQKIVELQSCANQHFNDANEILATCVLETIRLLGSILKEWRGKEKR